jgi:hypothetical protein
MEKSHFSTRKSAPRNKQGNLSVIEPSSSFDEKYLKSSDSHNPTMDTNRKLPSLHKRLRKRLIKPLYLKATQQMERRRMENKKKIQEQVLKNDKMRFELKEKRNMLERLHILGNISVGPNSTKNSNIREIWKNNASVFSVKNSPRIISDKIELGGLDSPSEKLMPIKDSLDREIEASTCGFDSQRRNKLHNQMSLASHIESSESFLNDTIKFNNTVKKRIFRKKKSRRRKRQNLSVIPKTIENQLTKKITKINPTFDEAFKYYESDIHELAEDPTVKTKLEHMTDFASPRFLIGLKKKQRMQEYWRMRVRKDFTKLNKEISEE